MFIAASEEGISTCRSKGSNGELIERTYNVIACQSLDEKTKNMEIAEDFESRPHKAVAFLIEKGKELQEMRQLEMPKALPSNLLRQVRRLQGRVRHSGFRI